MQGNLNVVSSFGPVNSCLWSSRPQIVNSIGFFYLRKERGAKDLKCYNSTKNVPSITCKNGISSSYTSIIPSPKKRQKKLDSQ